MAKALNTKNNGSTKPLVKVQRQTPIVKAVKNAPIVNPAPKREALQLTRNRVEASDSHRLQKAIKGPGRVGSGKKPGFMK